MALIAALSLFAKRRASMWLRSRRASRTGVVPRVIQVL